MKRARIFLLILPLVAGAFYLQSLTSWRPKVVFREPGAIRNLIFSGDGKQLLVVSHNQTTRLSDLTNLEVNGGFVPLWHHDKPLGSIRTPQFLAGDAQLLVQNEFSATLILDSRTGQTLHNCGVLKPAVASPDGRWLAYFDYRRDAPSIGGYYPAGDWLPPTTNYRNFATAKRLEHLLKTSPAFTFSPDGKTFVAGVNEQWTAHLDFYDVETAKRTRTVKAFPEQSPPPRYRSIQWSRNGQYVLSVGGTGYKRQRLYANLRRLSDGKELESTSVESYYVYFPSPDQPPSSFEVQDDGCVLGYSPHGPVYLSDAANLDLTVRTLLFLTKETISAATMSPDGSTLLVGTQSGHIYQQRIK